MFLGNPRVIYTYHQDCPDLMEVYHGPSLLEMWCRVWRAAGWEPLILTRSDAERHPRWTEFSARVSALPSSNSRDYENACYFRWLAMAAAGGGFMADADVFPLCDWQPRPGRELDVYSIDHKENDAACPCFVHGTAAQYEHVCERFAAFDGASAVHLSDQVLLRSGLFPFRQRADVLTYGDPRLPGARAVHLKTDAIRDLGLEKTAAVKSIVAQMLGSHPPHSRSFQILSAALAADAATSSSASPA